MGFLASLGCEYASGGQGLCPCIPLGPGAPDPDLLLSYSGLYSVQMPVQGRPPLVEYLGVVRSTLPRGQTLTPKDE